MGSPGGCFHQVSKWSVSLCYDISCEYGFSMPSSRVVQPALVVETHLWRSFIFLCWEICILPILCHGVSIWVLLNSDPISTDGVGLGLISCTRFFLPTMATGEQLSLFAIFYSQWVELPHSYFMDWQPTVVPGFMQKACIQLSTVYRPEGSSPDIVKR